MEHRTGHHVHEAPVHDDGGNVVVPVDFPYGEVDELLAAQGNDGPMPETISASMSKLIAQEVERRMQIEEVRIVQRTLIQLQENASDPEQIGRKVMMYSHLMIALSGPGKLHESQAGLARRMQITPGRLSQIKRQTAQDFREFSQKVLRR